MFAIKNAQSDGLIRKNVSISSIHPSIHPFVYLSMMVDCGGEALRTISRLLWWVDRCNGSLSVWYLFRVQYSSSSSFSGVVVAVGTDVVCSCCYYCRLIFPPFF